MHKSLKRGATLELVNSHLPLVVVNGVEGGVGWGVWVLNQRSLDLDLVASLLLVEVAQHFKGTADLGFAQFLGVWLIWMAPYEKSQI
jgi:hypothetical protein